jgi:hypothetical protein
MRQANSSIEFSRHHFMNAKSMPKGDLGKVSDTFATFFMGKREAVGYSYKANTLLPEKNRHF